MVFWGQLVVTIHVFDLGHAVLQVRHVVSAKVCLFESHAIHGLVWVKPRRLPGTYHATMRCLTLLMLNRVELLPCVNVSPRLEKVPLIPTLPHLPLTLINLFPHP